MKEMFYVSSNPYFSIMQIPFRFKELQVTQRLIEINLALEAIT
jgi:hypothetical protein